MSILQPKEETIDISVNEVKQLIAHDLGITPDIIDLTVKVENLSVGYFNNSSMEKATALLASVTLPGKTQKFEISEKDLKVLLEKTFQQDFDNNILIFNYQESQNKQYELISVSVAQKPDLTQTSDDLLGSSLSNMNNLVNSMNEGLQPKSLDDMSSHIDLLEKSIQQAKDVMRRNKF